MIAAAAMIDIVACIDSFFRTIGFTGTGHTGVVYADQAVCTLIRAVRASRYRSDFDFDVIAIR